MYSLEVASEFFSTSNANIALAAHLRLINLALPHNYQVENVFYNTERCSLEGIKRIIVSLHHKF
jgi:hypothetical protein